MRGQTEYSRNSGDVSVNQLHEELCILLGAITGSPRVMLVRVEKSTSMARILATTLGEKITVDLKGRKPILTNDNPVLFVPSVKDHHELSTSPLTLVVPNAKLVAGYLIEETEVYRWFILAWNPSLSYFENDDALALVVRVVRLCKRVVEKKFTKQDDAIRFVQKATEQTILKEEVYKFQTEPISKFLFDTLVPKHRLLGRNGAAYLAVRQWRKSIKPYQLKAMEAIKATDEHVSLDNVAAEMAAAVQKIYGNLFTAVVPIPGGSSGKQKSFSVALAEAVASKLKIPCKDILIGQPVAKGASHPKKSASLKPYTLREKISGYILVVDDVATSGRHIELAIEALKPDSNFCAAVAWISD